MKKIAFFCIPAHGHTNPMLPVAAELVRRGNTVRFYSFNEFEEKVRATGAEFISCDSFLPVLTEREEAGLKTVSTTEMTIQDIRITLSMDAFLDKEFKTFCPDVVYSDSVCFWGKLNAWKHKVPLVVSTSTFAFNQKSSQYMKNSLKELADLVLGLPRITRELKTLEPYGYHVKGALSLVQSDNETDSIVYTSRNFQPCAESFSDHYAFVGPSVFSKAVPDKNKQRPLVYISLGTVINDRPDFYGKCIEALKDLNADVIISCGNAIDREALGTLPDNIQVYPYVDQLDVLSRASAFITHCGMNSVSESLYMAIVLAASLIVGAYDGFYGPGTGCFLILIFCNLAKLDLRTAAGNVKIVNLASNAGALFTSLMNGKVFIVLGLIGALFSILGNYLGSSLAIKDGSKIIRPVILLVLVLLTVKVVTELI